MQASQNSIADARNLFDNIDRLLKSNEKADNLFASHNSRHLLGLIVQLVVWQNTTDRGLRKSLFDDFTLHDQSLS